MARPTRIPEAVRARPPGGAVKRLEKLLAHPHFRKFVSATDAAALVAHLTSAPGDRPGAFSTDFEHYLHNLKELFLPFAEWGDWNERVLDLWFARKTWWANQGYAVMHWAAQEIDETPGGDGYERLRRVLSGRGVSDDAQLALTARHLLMTCTVVKDDGAVTSVGRWLDAHPDELDRLWEKAALTTTTKASPNATVNELPCAVLAVYLLARRPEEFERRRAAGHFDFTSSDAKLLLGKRMATAPASRVARAGAAKGKAKGAAGPSGPSGPSGDDLIDSVHGAEALLAAAQAVFARDPKRARTLAERALDEAHPEKDFEYGIDATAWLFDRYGVKGALPSVRHFHTVNPAARVEWLKVVVSKAKQAAVPILVDCLVMPFDTKTIWGFMDHPKYVAAIGKLLAGADLRPHRATIEAHFQTISSKKVGELVAQLVSGRGGRAERAKPDKPFALPKTRYQIDRYVAALAAAAVKAAVAKKRSLTGPITSVKLYHEESSRRISAILLEAGGTQLPISTTAVKTALPDSLEDDRFDRPLAQLLRRHGYDLEADVDELPAWDDEFGLPAAILNHELVLGARQVKAALARAGLAVDEDCACTTGDHDSDWDDETEFVSHIQSGLSSFASATLIKELASLFFEDEKRRRWLVKLAG
jgi:hypothetical protein